MPRFSRNEIEKYYEILGLDPKQEGLVSKDYINLSYIGELYELNEFERKLPYSSKELSDSYSLLLCIIKDGFWYSSKKRREDAYKAAHDIIDDLTVFKIYNENEQEEIDQKQDKINYLKISIINGLCQAGDLIKFRFYQNNYSFLDIYNRIIETEKEEYKRKINGNTDEENESKELKTLYYLVALSKFYRSDYESVIFDGTGRVFLPNLKLLIKKRGITESQYKELLNQGYDLKKIEDNPKQPISLYVIKKQKKSN